MLLEACPRGASGWRLSGGDSAPDQYGLIHWKPNLSVLLVRVDLLLVDQSIVTPGKQRSSALAFTLVKTRFEAVWLANFWLANCLTTIALGVIADGRA